MNVFAQTLERNRTQFNAQFATARQNAPSLDGDEFLALLRNCAAPVVARCDELKPERTEEIATVLYDTTLQLLARGLIGGRARLPLLQKLWAHDLIDFAPMMILSPRRVVGSICNAVSTLSQTPNARGAQWLELMRDLVSQIDDVILFLDVGRVAAWRCGLAPTREHALEIGASLPPNIARIIFDLPDANADSIAQMWQNWRSNKWLQPREAASNEAAAQNATSSTRSLKVVAQAGAFRGFGGTFLKPPRVRIENDMLLASDSEQTWRVFADVFGATLLRVSVESAATGAFGSVPQWNRVLEALPEAQNATSAAFDGQTTALTLATSHHVWLLA